MKIVVFLLINSIGLLLIMLGVMKIIDHVQRQRLTEKRVKPADMPEPKTRALWRNIKAALGEKRLIAKAFEKRDKEFGVIVAPSILAPTWRRVYLLLWLASGILPGVALAGGAPNIALIAIGEVLAFVNFSVMAMNGKNCIAHEDKTYDKVMEVVKSHMHVDAGVQPRDIIEISGWEWAGEAQELADARTKAAEAGKEDELDKKLPRPDKKGRKKLPAIAGYRDVPSAMLIHIPTSFRDTEEDYFMEHLNQSVTANHKVEWVAEKEAKDDKGRTYIENGWDYDDNTVTLRTMPPLPQMASIPEDVDKGPWNAIRLGRTVKGEAIWDLSGQGDGKGGGGTATPMALVPLSVDTLVWVVEPDSEPAHDGRRDPEPSTDAAVKDAAGPDAGTAAGDGADSRRPAVSAQTGDTPRLL